MSQVANGPSRMRLSIWAVEWRCPTEMDSSEWPPPSASTALCQNEYANAPDYPFCPNRNLLLWSVTLTCREITWESDNPDAQTSWIRVGRCMAYDDHCMKCSRVQLWKTIGMEIGWMCLWRWTSLSTASVLPSLPFKTQIPFEHKHQREGKDAMECWHRDRVWHLCSKEANWSPVDPQWGGLQPLQASYDTPILWADQWLHATRRCTILREGVNPKLGPPTPHHNFGVINFCYYVLSVS